MARASNEAVLKYLHQQNRPYSAVDILNNLHKEFGKTQIQKSLDQLCEDGKIREKANGKQKVYSIVQSDVKGEDMKKELQSLDIQCSERSMKLAQAEQGLRMLETKLRDLNALPKTEDAASKLAELDDKVQLLKKKLQDLSANTVKISPAEKAKIIKIHEVQLKESRKRKRICTDILDSILEGYPKDKKTLMEEIGIEDD